MKNKEDFINDALPEEFANERDYYAELKLEHYEMRRQEKLKLCIEVSAIFPWLSSFTSSRKGIESFTK